MIATEKVKVSKIHETVLNIKTKRVYNKNYNRKMSSYTYILSFDVKC